MNLIYEKLYAYYGAERLQEAETCDQSAIAALLDGFPMDKKARLRPEEAFFDRYLQWTADGFAVGLHLGLRLLQDQFRRPEASEN